MSFSFTAAEELREVAEREAVAMAEKEEAWEEQKITLKVRVSRNFHEEESGPIALNSMF